MKTLESRLASLERGLRRWKLISCCLATAVVGAYVMAAAPQPVPDVLRCHKLEVVNQDGKVVARIWNAPAERHGDGGRLDLLGNDGTYRVSAGAWDGLGAKPNLRGANLTLSNGDTSLMTFDVDQKASIVHFQPASGPLLDLVASQEQPTADIVFRDSLGERHLGTPHH